MKPNYQYHTEPIRERYEKDGTGKGGVVRVDLIENSTGRMLFFAELKHDGFFTSKWAICDSNGVELLRVKRFFNRLADHVTLSVKNGPVVFKVKNPMAGRLIRPKLRFRREYKFKKLDDQTPAAFEFYDDGRYVGCYTGQRRLNDRFNPSTFKIAAEWDCILFMFSVTIVLTASEFVY
jgi:hypothetical protein